MGSPQIRWRCALHASVQLLQMYRRIHFTLCRERGPWQLTTPRIVVLSRKQFVGSSDVCTKMMSTEHVKMQMEPGKSILSPHVGHVGHAF